MSNFISGIVNKITEGFQSIGEKVANLLKIGNGKTRTAVKEQLTYVAQDRINS